MATIKQYAMNLWRVHKGVSSRLGADVSWGDTTERVRVLSTDLMLAGLIKALTDKGVLTDAEVSAVYNQINNAALPTLAPIDRPDLEHGGQAPDPDIGG